jgi:hypothetical protein
VQKEKLYLETIQSSSSVMPKVEKKAELSYLEKVSQQKPLATQVSQQKPVSSQNSGGSYLD